MRFDIQSGPIAHPIFAPKSGVPVPAGFVAAIEKAVRFVGKFSKRLPDAQYVYVGDGKVLATNNRHIVEFDLAPNNLVPFCLAARDVRLVANMGGDPESASVTDGAIELVWPDGRWLRIALASTSLEIVGKCEAWLDRYWVEPISVPPLTPRHSIRQSRTEATIQQPRFPSARAAA